MLLEIEVLATRHNGWGWSSVIEGLGFLWRSLSRANSFPLATRRRDVRFIGSGRRCRCVRSWALCRCGARRGRRLPHASAGTLAAISMCANCARAQGFTCRYSIAVCSSVSGDFGRRAQGDGAVRCITRIECLLDVDAPLPSPTSVSRSVKSDTVEASETAAKDSTADAWVSSSRQEPLT